jgi:hypothetical protein
MTRQDMERITDLLIEVGGRTPWVLLWDEDSEAVLSSMAVEAVPQVICSHLLKMLRGELGPQEIIAVEH